MPHDMQSSSKLINTSYWSLESQYLVQSDTSDTITISDDISGTFCHETDIDSDIDFNVLLGTTTIVKNKTADCPSNWSSE